MKKLMILLPIACIFFSTTCMDNDVSIITSDSKKIILPQWKIEASRLLHIKQELQKFNIRLKGGKEAPFLLKTIGSQKLKLFSRALEVHDFPNYFNALTPEKKHLLLCVAGEQELDSPVIMTQLLTTLFASDFIEKNIYPCLETFVVADYVQRLIIFDSCKNKKFIRNPNQLYIDDSCALSKQNGGGYYFLPKSLKTNTNFCGFTVPAIVPLQNSETWLIDNVTSAAEPFFLLYYANGSC